MEVITPLGVPRLFSPRHSVAATLVRFKTQGSSKQDHRDFPDPRLFDFDDNGKVDANDIIQEHQIRKETREAADAKTPLAKYVVQSDELKGEPQSVEPAASKQISIFA